MASSISGLSPPPPNLKVQESQLKISVPSYKANLTFQRTSMLPIHTSLYVHPSLSDSNDTLDYKTLSLLCITKTTPNYYYNLKHQPLINQSFVGMKLVYTCTCICPCRGVSFRTGCTNSENSMWDTMIQIQIKVAVRFF